MDSQNFQWPDDFQEQCPPSDALPCSGKVYRLVSSPIDSDKDFLSLFERSLPFRNKVLHRGDNEEICRSKGLSVYRKIDGALEAQRQVPRLNKLAIASGILSDAYGVMKPTPSNMHQSHCTWWVPTDVDPAKDFRLEDK